MDDQQKNEFDLELAKIELEREKLKLERNKAIWTSLSIFIPLLIAALTIAFNAWSQARQAQSAFLLQTAEIVMNADSPTGSFNKARALAALFPQQLPSDFSTFTETFDPAKYSVPTTSAQKTLLEWLILYPDQRQQILDDWLSLFPKDEWVEALR